MYPQTRRPRKRLVSNSRERRENTPVRDERTNLIFTENTFKTQHDDERQGSETNKGEHEIRTGLAADFPDRISIF